MYRKLDEINVDELLKEYEKLEPKIKWTEYENKGKQAGLQYKINEDPYTSAVGKRVSKNVLYSELNPIFKDTLFENVILKYNLTRSRLMWVYKMSCYSMHRDDTCRVHIPMITNPDCFLVFKHLPPVHLPKGNSYFVETTKYHTFINCSEFHRLHFVGCL